MLIFIQYLTYLQRHCFGDAQLCVHIICSYLYTQYLTYLCTHHPINKLIDMEMEVCNEQTANKLGSTITNFLSNLNNDTTTSQSKPTPTIETNGELEVEKKEEMPIITPKTQQAINRGISPKSQQVINNTFTTPTAAASVPPSSVVSPLSVN